MTDLLILLLAAWLVVVVALLMKEWEERDLARHREDFLTTASEDEWNAWVETRKEEIYGCG